MAITIDALFKNVLEPRLNRIFTEEYNNMAITDITINPPSSYAANNTIGNGDSIIFDANTVTWTAVAGDTSTITDNTWVFDEGTVSVKIYEPPEPPKTYLQLPIGKRLISI